MIYHFLDFLQLGDEIQEEYRKNTSNSSTGLFMHRTIWNV